MGGTEKSLILSNSKYGQAGPATSAHCRVLLVPIFAPWRSPPLFLALSFGILAPFSGLFFLSHDKWLVFS